MQMTKRMARIWAVLFVLLIATGTIGFFLTPQRAFSKEENRVLQTRPAFSWQRLLNGTLVSELERYACDQFPLRDSWIEQKSQLERWMGKKENNGVYFGSDGTLLEALLPQNEQVLRVNLAGVEALASELHTTAVLMPVPGNAWVNRAALPAFAPVPDQRTQWQWLRDHASGHVRVADVFTPLDEVQGPLYFATDHHWNERGAYIGYRALMQALGHEPLSQHAFVTHEVSRTFYGTLTSKSGVRDMPGDSIYAIATRDGVSPRMEVADDGTARESLLWTEKLLEKDQYAYYLGGNHAVTVVYGTAQNGRRLLLIKDSYAHILAPYLSAQYEEIHLIDPRYFNAPVSAYYRAHGCNELAVLFSMKFFNEDTTLRKLR